MKKIDNFENKYVKKYYENYSINRWLVTTGGKINATDLNLKVLFHLNDDGTYLLNKKAPDWLKNSFERVINN